MGEVDYDAAARTFKDVWAARGFMSALQAVEDTYGIGVDEAMDRWVTCTRVS